MNFLYTPDCYSVIVARVTSQASLTELTETNTERGRCEIFGGNGRKTLYVHERIEKLFHHFSFMDFDWLLFIGCVFISLFSLFHNFQFLLIKKLWIFIQTKFFIFFSASDLSNKKGAGGMRIIIKVSHVCFGICLFVIPT
jgi:hypothetical protein